MRQITPAQLNAWLDDSGREQPLVAICHHGGRSMQVALFLEKNGHKEIHNLQGGVDAWSRTVDPSLPVY